MFRCSVQSDYVTSSSRAAGDLMRPAELGPVRGDPYAVQRRGSVQTALPLARASNADGSRHGLVMYSRFRKHLRAGPGR